MRLLLAFLLAPCLAWGATGSAGVDTFYVRPGAECSLSGDGMAYACANSAGGTGAWRKLNAIVWTVTVGVDDGDTLYVCGNFVSGDERNTTTMLDVAPASGGAASESARITVNGDCSAFGGPSKATINGAVGDGTYATSSAVLINTGNPSYVTFKNFKLYGDRPAAQGGGGATLTTGTGTGVTIDSIEAYPNKLGINLNGTTTVVQNSIIDARSAETDAINLGNFISGTITGNTLYSNRTGNSSDVVDCSCPNMTSVTVSNNSLYKGSGDKSALTIKSSSGAATVTNNHFYGQQDNSYGFRMETAFSGSITMTRNVFDNFGSEGNALQLDNATTTASITAIGNIFIGGQYQVAIGDGWTANLYNNTFIKPVVAAVYSNGTAPLGPASVTLKNNAFVVTSRFIHSSNYEDAMAMDYDAYSGGADFFVGGSRKADVAALTAAIGAYEPHAVSSAPKFVGTEKIAQGPLYVTDTDVRIDSASPLKAAGINLGLGGVSDYGGRAYLSAPAIGAWESSSGDVAARTVATTRSTATARSAATARTAR